MSSSCVVKIWNISEILSHPHADRLVIAKVGGWTCCVGKDSFAVGDLAVYFPPDTVLSKEWTDKFGVTKFCQEITENNTSEPSHIGRYRIRCAKLRQVPSFGLLVPVKSLYTTINGPAQPITFSKNEDVALFFGAEKHAPPLVCTAGDAETPNPFFPKFTDIENGRNWPTVFKDGELVNVTEKIDGTNVRFGVVKDDNGNLNWMAGSHTVQRKRPATDAEILSSLYWYPCSIPEVKTLIESLAKHHQNVVVFGETYGRVQQKRGMSYGKLNSLGFAAFDIYVDGKYMDNDNVLRLLKEFNVPSVPFIGQFPYSLELMDQLSKGDSLFAGASHIREGVVVRAAKEGHSELVGRKVLKWLNPDFLLKIASSREELDTTDA